MTIDSEGEMVSADVPSQPQTSRLPHAAVSHKLLFLWTAIGGVIVDQLTKAWVERNMPLNTSLDLFGTAPYFQLTHVANTGAAFGVADGTGLGWFFTMMAVIVALSLVVYNFVLPTHHRLLRFTFGLILAGAVGNLIDRLRIGHVTDFVNMNVYPLITIPRLRWLLDYPIWNIADLCVVTGVIILAVMMWRQGDDFPIDSRERVTDA